MQVGTHFQGVLVTQIAVFLQSLVNDPFQFGRYFGIQPYRSDRSSVQDRLEDGCCTVSAERQLPGGYLIENSSKRKQIAPRIQFFSRAPCSGDI